uniref:Uncharacterized protein n=1 Tax=Arundo donax TaxID=35708 RepID=A0A0A9G330_ARUDO
MGHRLWFHIHQIIRYL